MNRTILITGVLFGVLSVILGAFGAHGLKELISETSLESYKTAVTYQMYHALLLLWLGSSDRISLIHKKWIFRCIAIGVIFFSFSIYFLATNSLTAFDFKTIGFITPIGGAILILGWALLAYHLLKHER